MPCTLRKFSRDELTDNANVTAGTKRMQRLKDLICGGTWGNKNKTSLIYWKLDDAAPDGGYWVAWDDPDALAQADVTVP